MLVLLTSCIRVNEYDVNKVASQKPSDVVVDTNKESQPSTTNPIVQTPTAVEKPAGANIPVCGAPSGFMSLVYLRQKNYVNQPSFFGTPDDNKARVVGIFKYTGNCIADKIYIEAGLRNEPSGSLVFLPINPSGFARGEPSACDGSKNYQGVVFRNVQPNQDLTFDILIENYGVKGAYPVNIGAYTGCLKAGGYTIQEIYGRTSFSNDYSPVDLANSYVQVK